MVRTAALELVALAGCLLGACADEPEVAARVLVVGVDGLEWNVLRPLLARGECPNLRGLMERGSFGHLATLTPTLSPILWTTIATGKLPEQHGIHGFTDDALAQYTSSQRRCAAIWNVADRAGLSSNVIGWWITWPAEEIRGLVVSGSSSSALVDANWKPTLLPEAEHQVHPREATAAVMAIAERTGAVEAVQRLANEKVFGALPEGELGAVERTLIQETLWSIQADATYYEIARAMLRERPADLNLLYLGGPDVVGHRFWRYYEPSAFRWPDDPGAEERWQAVSPGSDPLATILAKTAGTQALAQVIPNYYRWLDEMLGGLIEAVGEDATVIVVSDHGMHASSTDEPNPRFLTGHHQDGAPGVFVAAGPGIARRGDAAAFVEHGTVAVQGSVLGLMPLLCALLDLPSARDLPEQAHLPLLEGRARERAAAWAERSVDSHDAGFRPPQPVEVPAEMTASFLQRFRALGYVGMEDSTTQRPALVDPRTYVPDTRWTSEDR